MYLISDEAGSSEKGYQGIAWLLIWQGQSEMIQEVLESQLGSKELKFARVRTNASYTEYAKEALSVFFDTRLSDEGRLIIMQSKSDVNEYLDMYEEIFLLAQSFADQDIIFQPDKNTILQRWKQVKKLRDFGIAEIQEQDSSTNTCVQIMDIIAWISVFLHEHYGTYRTWKESGNRFEQMDEYARDLHLRCELVHHFFGLLETSFWEVTLHEHGLRSISSESVMVLEY